LDALFIMIKQLYSGTLPIKTDRLIRDFEEKRPNFLDYFYLSGGTALSLQLNHRRSVDLDFFSKRDFAPRLIQEELEKFGKLDSLELEENTLNTFLKGVQLQFLGYPYPLLKPLVNWRGIKISSVIDIACTKLQTVSQRGGKKDFIDLYFILEKYSLRELFKEMDKKYQKADFNKVHILKSLVYFADADLQPMPKMCRKISWEEIKSLIISKATSFRI